MLRLLPKTPWPPDPLGSRPCDESRGVLRWPVYYYLLIFFASPLRSFLAKTSFLRLSSRASVALAAARTPTACAVPGPAIEASAGLGHRRAELSRGRAEGPRTAFASLTRKRHLPRGDIPSADPLPGGGPACGEGHPLGGIKGIRSDQAGIRSIAPLALHLGPTWQRSHRLQGPPNKGARSRSLASRSRRHITPPT